MSMSRLFDWFASFSLAEWIMFSLVGNFAFFGWSVVLCGWIRRMFGENRLLREIGSSSFHAAHHQHPTSNFGFYTQIWDRLFGTLK